MSSWRLASRRPRASLAFVLALASGLAGACHRAAPKSEDSPVLPIAASATAPVAAKEAPASSFGGDAHALAGATDGAGPRDASVALDAGTSLAIDSPRLPPEARACSHGGAGHDAGAEEVSCTAFPTVTSAFAWILAHEPRVLAVGEAHAPKGSERIASATKRFTEAMLPALEDRASDLIVEAWAPDPRCKTEVAAVAETQAPVKAAQASSNTNEYVALGTRARQLGIVPYLLRPTCDDFTTLAQAGDDAISASLLLIERLTERDVLRAVARQGVPAKMVVTYGGAMHNDLSPSAELAAYSFGPALARATGEAYVELDLIVPEYIRPTDSWQRLAFYGPYMDLRSRGALGREVLLYRTGPRSFTLVFPRSG